MPPFTLPTANSPGASGAPKRLSGAGGANCCANRMTYWWWSGDHATLTMFPCANMRRFDPSGSMAQSAFPRKKAIVSLPLSRPHPDSSVAARQAMRNTALMAPGHLRWSGRRIVLFIDSFMRRYCSWSCPPSARYLIDTGKIGSERSCYNCEARRRAAKNHQDGCRTLIRSTEWQGADWWQHPQTSRTGI